MRAASARPDVNGIGSETPSVEARAEIAMGRYLEGSFASDESLKTTETLRSAMWKYPCLSSAEGY
jgi:hypothetical protein